MSKGLILVLNFIFDFTQDWGLAIVGLTIFVKLLLLPISLKQKENMAFQEVFNEEVNLIKEKYKEDEDRLNQELMSYYGKNKSGLWTLIGTFIQLPIMISLFKVIRTANISGGTVILPWIESLNSPDGKFIVPLIYVGVSLLPAGLAYLRAASGKEGKGVKSTGILVSVLLGLFISLSSPVSLSIYFIFSSLISFFEDVFFSRNGKKQVLS